jgi:chaperonin GroES
VTTATKVVLKPLEDRIVVRTLEADAKRVPMDVKVGDIVLYSKYGGTEVKYHGEEYLVLSARDVLAIIEK